MLCIKRDWIGVSGWIMEGRYAGIMWGEVQRDVKTAGFQVRASGGMGRARHPVRFDVRQQGKQNFWRSSWICGAVNGCGMFDTGK